MPTAGLPGPHQAHTRPTRWRGICNRACVLFFRTLRRLFSSFSNSENLQILRRTPAQHPTCEFEEAHRLSSFSKVHGPHQARTRPRTRPQSDFGMERGRISDFGMERGRISDFGGEKWLLDRSRGAGLAQTEAAEPASLFQAFCALFGPKERAVTKR